MLSIKITNLLRSPLQLYNKIISLNKALHSTFTGRDILANDSHGEAGTLSVRFVKYLAINSCKFDPLIPQIIKYSDFYPVEDIHHFNSLLKTIQTDQIPKLINFTFTYKSNGDPNKVAHVLNRIDEISTQRLDDFDNDAILRILHAFAFVIPNKITKLQFYGYAMSKLVDEFDSSSPTSSKDRFVQVCYFLGLSKRNSRGTELMRKFISLHLERYLDDLSTLEFAIVSNATYKTSLAISANQFNERLIKEIEQSDGKDDALMVTFLKCLRLNRVKAESLYEKLKSLLLSGGMDHFHFKGLIHCFSYFAEGLWNDKDVCKVMVEKCLTRLDEFHNNAEYVFNDMRAKDVASFLWCCATLNLDILFQQADFELIENIILEKIDNYEYQNCPDELIDSALSLWMLNYKSKEIISTVFRLNTIPRVKSVDRVKLDSRIRLLRSCVHIEKPEWMAEDRKDKTVFIENRKAPDYLIANRVNLQLLKRVLDHRRDEFDFNSYAIVSPIDEINCAGFLFDAKDGKCFLEIIEDQQILKYDYKLVPIVQLKVNLLQKLGYKVLMIWPDEFESEEDLFVVLKEKLLSLNPDVKVETVK